MITLNDTVSWTMREEAHHNGGDAFFAYTERCPQQPRLTRYARYDKRTKTSTRTWKVDGIEHADLAAAIDALNVPAVATAEELTILATVTTEPADRRKEMIANYEPWNGLREKGFIHVANGRTTITATGLDALSTSGVSK